MTPKRLGRACRRINTDPGPYTHNEHLACSQFRRIKDDATNNYSGLGKVDLGGGVILPLPLVLELIWRVLSLNKF